MPDLWISEADESRPPVLPGQLELAWSTPGDTARFREALGGAQLVDRRGLPRTTATVPGYRAGRRNPSRGREYIPDPPRPEEISAFFDYLAAPTSKYETSHGAMSRERMYGATAVLWRTGLRISEFLALHERDLNRRDYSVLVRRGKGGKSRVVGMDDWGWEILEEWLAGPRKELPRGPLFPVVSGVTAGMTWSHHDVRRQMHRVAAGAGIDRRWHPHGLRHACAVGMLREGIDIFTISKQLGHSRVEVTMAYLRSITLVEIMEPIRNRRAPVMPIQARRPARWGG